MNVVELALIRQVILGDELTEIKMILTTPFCPYAGSMIQQVKEAAEEAEGHEVKVTLLAERWDPRDAGLTWWVTPRDSPANASRVAPSPRSRVTTVRPACSTVAASPRTMPAPRPTAPSTRPWPAWAWPAQSWEPCEPRA
jgi:hypothetical protein